MIITPTSSIQSILFIQAVCMVFRPPPHLLLQKDTDLSHFLQRGIFEGQIVDVSHSCIYYDFQPVDMFLEHVLFTGPLSCGLLVN